MNYQKICIVSTCKLLERYKFLGSQFAASYIFYLTESPPVRDLKKTNNDDGSVKLTWNAPLNFKGDNPNFVVEYNGKRYVLDFTKTEFVIPGGQDKSFTVKVRLERLC